MIIYDIRFCLVMDMPWKGRPDSMLMVWGRIDPDDLRSSLPMKGIFCQHRVANLHPRAIDKVQPEAIR